MRAKPKGPKYRNLYAWLVLLTIALLIAATANAEPPCEYESLQQHISKDASAAPADDEPVV